MNRFGSYTQTYTHTVHPHPQRMGHTHTHTQTSACIAPTHSQTPQLSVDRFVSWKMLRHYFYSASFHGVCGTQQLTCPLISIIKHRLRITDTTPTYGSLVNASLCQRVRPMRLLLECQSISVCLFDWHPVCRHNGSCLWR